MQKKITTYKQLNAYLLEFIEGDVNVMIIHGRGGTGKTSMLKPYLMVEKDESKKTERELGNSPMPEKEKEGDENKLAYIAGAQLTPFEMYCKCFKYRDIPLCLDDIDSIQRNDQMVNLLKLICQTEDVKTIGWHSGYFEAKGSDIPMQFETKSRALVLANEWDVRNASMEALITRGYMLEFDPDGIEVHEQAKQFIKDTEVLEFMEVWAPLVRLNLRDYYIAQNANKRNTLPWRDDLMESWRVHPCLPAVYKLLNDKQFKNNTQRVDAFRKLNMPEGNSRWLFYELRAQLTGGKSRKASRNTYTYKDERLSKPLA